MTAFAPATDTALAQQVVTIFGAIAIVLPDHTIQLLTGAGIVSFDGQTFTGSDPTYGTLWSIDDLTDGVGDQAPAMSLTLAPASNAAAATLASATMQGSAVTMWLGVIDPTTGLVIGDPLLVFLGELDVPTIKGGANSRLLDLEITSAFEDFFTTDDGVTLSDAFHQSAWPGERGMKGVTYVTHQLYWGSDTPSGVTR